MKLLKFAAGWFIPHSAVRTIKLIKGKRELSLRIERLKSASRLEEGKKAVDFDYDGAIDYLVSLGCEKSQVLYGSMPKESLSYVASLLSRLPQGNPINGLHIGNFVGVSLAYFTKLVVALHKDSIMVSIDPNIPHRGIINPLGKVVALLAYFGLEGNSVILTGYSLEKNVSNDGSLYGTHYDPLKNYHKEVSCTRQLEALKKLGMTGKFDFLTIDGNHDGSYLSREITGCIHLLKPEGLIVMDDVTSTWAEVKSIFEKLTEQGFVQVGYDGRVGILKIPNQK
ncbi:MAG TPA: class I SAM-dependent methyltransferase [Candidatus Acidoferrales bacterium]|nr:class I SAM-dependent methyltransferase [Candidatus Acidoferrales bacterium]